jgi:hypothetical protein
MMIEEMGHARSHGMGRIDSLQRLIGARNAYVFRVLEFEPNRMMK